MADYRLTEDTNIVIRTEDTAFIPDDMRNKDWRAYQKWLTEGNTPDPYVAPPPPPPPPPTTEQQVLFDHENRVRVLEGQPPLTMKDFINAKSLRGNA